MRNDYWIYYCVTVGATIIIGVGAVTTRFEIIGRTIIMRNSRAIGWESLVVARRWRIISVIAIAIAVAIVIAIPLCATTLISLTQLSPTPTPSPSPTPSPLTVTNSTPPPIPLYPP